MGQPGKQPELFEEPQDKLADDGSLDEYGDAGTACDIFNDDERVKTHFAVPCRHALCEVCWNTWLECSTKCPICGMCVTGTRRFSSSLVPLRHYEIASRCMLSPQSQSSSNIPQLYSLNGELEKTAHQAISNLVLAKDSFTSIGGRIAEVSAHLASLSPQSMDLETRLSIVAVEKSCMAEQFDLLSQVIEEQPASPWTAANTALRAFLDALERLGNELDRADEEPPSGLSSTQSLLANCTVKMFRGQWQPLRTSLTDLTENKIPTVLQQLAHAQQPLTQPAELQAMKRAVEMLQVQAQARIHKTETMMLQIYPELEVATVRVASMF